MSQIEANLLPPQRNFLTNTCFRISAGFDLTPSFPNRPYDLRLDTLPKYFGRVLHFHSCLSSPESVGCLPAGGETFTNTSHIGGPGSTGNCTQRASSEQEVGSVTVRTRGDRPECHTRVDPPGSARLLIPSSCTTEPRRFGRVVHVRKSLRTVAGDRAIFEDVLLVARSSKVHRRAAVALELSNTLFRRFRPNDLLYTESRTHQLPLTQIPSKFDERFSHTMMIKIRYYFLCNHLNEKSLTLDISAPEREINILQNSENQIEALSGLNRVRLPGKVKFVCC